MSEPQPLLEVVLEEHSQGVIVPVQAQPGARKNGITGQHAGRLKVAVTQAPEKGKANQALCAVLADELGLKRTQVQLLSGETTTQKKFLVQGITPAQLAERVLQKLCRD